MNNQEIIQCIKEHGTGHGEYWYLGPKEPEKVTNEDGVSFGAGDTVLIYDLINEQELEGRVQYLGVEGAGKAYVAFNCFFRGCTELHIVGPNAILKVLPPHVDGERTQWASARGVVE